MTPGGGRCCRLGHVLHAAEAEFGGHDSWWDLARRAAGHESHSLVIARFIARWEVMLGLGAGGPAGPVICASCRALLVAERDAARVSAGGHT